MKPFDQLEEETGLGFRKARATDSKFTSLISASVDQIFRLLLFETASRADVLTRELEEQKSSFEPSFCAHLS